MGKTIVQAVCTGLLALAVVTAVQIAIGVYRTMTYVPDIVQAYETVDHLQQRVAFGVIAGPGFPLREMSIAAAGAVVFLGIKLAIARFRSRSQ